MAGGSVNRSSVYGGGGGRGKDPRPLTDKGYLHQTARELISYIVERGYDGSQINVKALTTLSSKEFLSVFLFLMQRIDPTFEFVGRFEDELPILLKCMGYPFSMSRSALSAMGSPHTWGALIGVLEWLMGLAKFNELTAAAELSLNDANDVATRRDMFFIENTQSAYELWLGGAEDFTEIDAAREKFFENEVRGRSEEIETLEQKVTELRATVQSLQNTPAPLAIAKDHLKSIEANSNKFKHLLPSLSEHLDMVKKKVADKEKRNLELEESVKQLKEQKAKLEPILKKQENDSIDAQRMIEERGRLRSTMAQANTSGQRTEEMRKALERRTSAVEEKITELVNRHNEQLETFVKHRSCVMDDVQSEDGKEKFGTSPLNDMGTLDAQWKDSMTLQVSSDRKITKKDELLNRDVDGVISSIGAIRKEITRKEPELHSTLSREYDDLDVAEETRLVRQHDLEIAQGSRDVIEVTVEEKRAEFRSFLEARSKEILVEHEEMEKCLRNERELLAAAERQYNDLISTQNEIEKQRQQSHIVAIRAMGNDMKTSKDQLTALFLLLMEWKDDIERREDADNNHGGHQSSDGTAEADETDEIVDSGNASMQ